MVMSYDNDMSAAFDLVDQKILLTIMEKHGFPLHIRNIYQDFLTNGTFYCRSTWRILKWSQSRHRPCSREPLWTTPLFSPGEQYYHSHQTQPSNLLCRWFLPYNARGKLGRSKNKGWRRSNKSLQLVIQQRNGCQWEQKWMGCASAEAKFPI